ncbi:MAG: thiamine pyrophosphate-binding protein, partial [Actinobacteria bacterium]|nr:thiamine pyrophosphate-binding protein [Actinomycetota bacterium]
NLDLIGAFNRHGVEFVLAHTETGAAIMAATFSVVTNTVSAVIVTRGPGAASAVNGAASATLDRAPLLVITDCVPEATRARTGHQRFDQRALMRPVTLRTARIGNDVTQEQLVDLIATATGPLAGAVHIDLDAQSSTDIDDAIHQPSHSCIVDADEIRERLASCNSPVVICGSQAPSDCRDALERFGAPTLTTYQGAGLLPEPTPPLNEHSLATPISSYSSDLTMSNHFPVLGQAMVMSSQLTQRRFHTHLLPCQ